MHSTVHEAVTSALRTNRERAVSEAELGRLRQQSDIGETVDTAAAAALIGYKPNSLRRWACEGAGPIKPVRVNGRLRWRVKDLKALLSGEAA